MAVSIILLAGCATVKVYSDADLKNETGLRCYTLKPYLLVEYLAEKDNTVKTTVVYLPDLATPQFMVLKSGLGSSELKMSFNNSALESYGVVADSKLPESMEAFAAILSKSAYATQAFTGPETPGTLNPEPGTSFRLFEILPGTERNHLKGGYAMKNRILNRKIWVSGVPHKVGTGWLSPQPDLRDYTPASKQITAFNKKLKLPSFKAKTSTLSALRSPLKSSVDLREWCSPIENQLDLGCCTAHAAAGIVEYFERRAFGKHIDASRLFLYKTTRNLMQVTGDTGAWLSETMGALVLCGVPDEKYWPYKTKGLRQGTGWICLCPGRELLDN